MAKYTDTPSEIASLIDMTESLDLDQDIEDSLLAKLWHAAETIESSNAERRRNAANILEGFINAWRPREARI